MYNVKKLLKALKFLNPALHSNSLKEWQLLYSREESDIADETKHVNEQKSSIHEDLRSTE